MTRKTSAARSIATPHALVADDDDDLCILMSNALRRAGFEVHEARNGHELVVSFRAHATASTVVVSDIGMPECDGIAAAIAMRKLQPLAMIVLVSAFVDPATLMVARDAGASAVLHKPLDLGVLVQTVCCLLEQP